MCCKIRRANCWDPDGRGRRRQEGWALLKETVASQKHPWSRYDVRKLLREMVGASGFEPPTSWSRTINPRTIKDLAAAQQFCLGLRHVASLQRLARLSRAGSGKPE